MPRSTAGRPATRSHDGHNEREEVKSLQKRLSHASIVVRPLPCLHCRRGRAVASTGASTGASIAGQPHGRQRRSRAVCLSAFRPFVIFVIARMSLTRTVEGSGGGSAAGSARGVPTVGRSFRGIRKERSGGAAAQRLARCLRDAAPLPRGTKDSILRRRHEASRCTVAKGRKWKITRNGAERVAERRPGLEGR